MTRKFRPMALLLIFLVLSFFLQSTQGIEPYLRKNCTFGEYNASEFITFTMQGPSIGENSKKVERRVDLIKSDIEVSLNIESSLQIRLKVAPIVGNVSPYGLNIKQICNIYDHTCSNWAYVNDPRGLDWFQDATNILTTGDSCRKVGMGDCDDFAILIASFVENIGGATMVVVSSDPDGKSGHAYAEVYMGRIGEDDQNINNIIEWLRKKYNNENIGYDIPNPANGEVWLNLDYNSLCPGGPALKMAKNIPLVLREGINKVPLKPWDESLSIRHSFVPDLQQNQSEYRSNYLLRHATVLIEVGEPEEAIELFDEAIEANPQSYEASYGKGETLRQIGKYNESLDAFDEAVILDSRNSWPWVGKGRTFFAQGNYNDALYCFTKALELNPRYKLPNCDYAQIWREKADTLKALGNDIEADEAYEKALELESKCF